MDTRSLTRAFILVKTTLQQWHCWLNGGLTKVFKLNLRRVRKTKHFPLTLCALPQLVRCRMCAWNWNCHGWLLKVVNVFVMINQLIPVPILKLLIMIAVIKIYIIIIEQEYYFKDVLEEAAYYTLKKNDTERFKKYKNETIRRHFTHFYDKT